MTMSSPDHAAPAPAPASATVPALEAAGASQAGRQRSRNEDAYLIATLQRSMLVHDASPDAARGWFAGEQAGTLLVVADGMGGQGGGDIASQVAVRTIAGYLLNVMPWATTHRDGDEPRSQTTSIAGVRQELGSALVFGDYTVKSTGARVGNARMGTTLTAALLQWPTLYVAHVGDSRCCLFRSGVLMRLTTDHTVANRAAQEGSPLGPQSQWHHVLWNALGGDENGPTPELSKTQVELGDLILLCTDGLTKHLSDEDIAGVLGRPQSNAERCAALVARAYDRGGTDDITVVLAGASPN